jgi:polar amino acid transport system substrate-binding protein
MGKYLKFLSMVAVVMVLVVTGCGPAATPTVAPVPTAAPKVVPPPMAPGALITLGEIHFGADFSAPPNQFIDEQGNMDGLNPDICNEIAKRLGLEAKWTNLGFPGLIPGLQAQRFDALCTSVFINPDRMKIMNMVPYVKWGEGVLVKAGNPEGITCSYTVGQNDSYDECYKKMQGKAIAVGTAGTQETHFREYNAKFKAAGQPEIILRGFDTGAEIFQALASGQVVGAALNDPALPYFMSRNPGKYEVAFSGYSLVPLSLPTLKENRSLAEAIKWALEQMKADGTYQSILKKWNLSPVESFDIQTTD